MTNYTRESDLKQLLQDFKFITNQLGYYESKVFNLVTDYYTTEELKAIFFGLFFFWFVGIFERG